MLARLFCALAAVVVFVTAIRDAEDSDQETNSVPPTQSFNSNANDEFVYRLQHCLSPPCNPFSLNPTSGFVDRGLIKYKRSKRIDGFVTIVQNLPIEEKDFKGLMKLEHYSVRLVCDPTSACDVSPSTIVFSTIDACWLRQANFRDGISLHVSKTGVLVGMDYFAESDSVCSSAEVPLSRKFQTRCNVPLAITFTKLEVPTEHVPTDERGNPKPKEDQEPQGLFGLFRRYWYVILPLVVMMSLQQPPEQAPGQGQGQGAQGGGGRRAGAGASAAAK